MNMDEPLIYTTKGNVPISSLRLDPRWEINDEVIACAVHWFDSSGEEVRKDVYKYGLKPLELVAQQQEIA